MAYLIELINSSGEVVISAITKDKHYGETRAVSMIDQDYGYTSAVDYSISQVDESDVDDLLEEHADWYN